MLDRIPEKDRTCTNCSWFKKDPNRPVHNRECLYPGKVYPKVDHCAMWKDMRTLKQKLKGERPNNRLYV